MNPRIDERDIRPLRRDEYDRMVSCGLFSGEKIELLEGFLVVMEPQGPEHSNATRRIRDALAGRIGSRAMYFDHSPLAMSGLSEPEPDVAVVPPGDYDARLPSSAFLVVEVALSSTRKDRDVKSVIYAQAGVPEYWLVDLVERVVERRTEPAGGLYRKLETLRAGDRLGVLAFPDVAFDVSELLPHREPST